VANFKVIVEPGIQWRRDRLPSVTVRGVVPDGVQASDVTTAIFAKLKPLRDSLSADYRVEMQGAVEESAKSQTAINEKMPAMLLVILLLLMVQLQHFGKTLMVLATGPLGLIGAARRCSCFRLHSASLRSSASLHRRHHHA
jgi:multidrug efflux pump subunit AcrB